MKKKYIIVSPVRFAVFLTMCAVILIFITSTLVAFSFTSDRAVSIPETDSYIKVSVSAGDTIWDIAREYTDNKTDVRKTVYDICEINNISPEKIRPGDIIYVPALI